MNPRWLYFLLMFALLLPAARPRTMAATIAGSLPLSGAAQGSNPTETEEEEVHQRTSTSRQTERIARGSTRDSLEHYSLPQRARIASAKTAAVPMIVDTHNGFGGNITC